MLLDFWVGVKYIQEFKFIEQNWNQGISTLTRNTVNSVIYMYSKLCVDIII